MNATDAIAAVFGSLVSLLLFAGLYVWTSLALSAVFRKSGVEPWKAWVPILNSVVLLQLAGISPWLLLLALVPVLGWIALLVLFALTFYRVNVAFGFGVGMTVLALVAVPVWASIVGWGSARWVGWEPGAGVRRSADPADELPPLPPFPSPRSREDTTFPPAPTAAVSHGFAPPPAYVPPTSASATAAPTASAEPAAGAEWDSGDAVPAAVPSAGSWAPPSLPGRPVAVSAGSAGAAGDDDPDPWQGFALDSADLSAEVTGAVPGAPAPISALPAAAPAAPAPAPISAAPVAAPESFAAPEAAVADEGIMRPPVRRTSVAEAGSDLAAAPGDAPAAPAGAVRTDGDRAPWGPARSPMSEADAFPEASGPVSAIIGAPDAGAPRSARSSVSAFHGKPEIPDEQDILEETIIARRKRTDWTLVPPTGEPVALSSEVVILGRRPATDPDFPGAQLVAIQDGTVSKTHARLQLRDERWFVTDLDSTNGVLFATVMGTEVEAPPGEAVEAGDRFLLGDAEIRLHRGDG